MSRKITVLSLAAAVLPMITRDPLERAARFQHECATARDIKTCCDFRFCHCPHNTCANFNDHKREARA